MKTMHQTNDFSLPVTESQVSVLVCALISITPRNDGSKPYLANPATTTSLVEKQKLRGGKTRKCVQLQFQCLRTCGRIPERRVSLV